MQRWSVYVDLPVMIMLGALLGAGAIYAFLWNRRGRLTKTIATRAMTGVVLASLTAIALSGVFVPGDWIYRSVSAFIAIFPSLLIVIPLFGITVAFPGWREEWIRMRQWHPLERIGSFGMAAVLLLAIWGVLPLLLAFILPVESLPRWAVGLLRELSWLVILGLCALTLAVRGVLGQMMRFQILSACLLICVAAEVGLLWMLSDEMKPLYLGIYAALVACNYYAWERLLKQRLGEWYLSLQTVQR